VSEALEKFAARDKQKAELVKLRYSVGLTTEKPLKSLAFPCRRRIAGEFQPWLFRGIEREQKR